jgi:hypothetical protein
MQTLEQRRVESIFAMIVETDFQSIAKPCARLLNQVEIDIPTDDIDDDFDPALFEMPDSDGIRERPVDLQHLDRPPSPWDDDRARVGKNLTGHVAGL